MEDLLEKAKEWKRTKIKKAIISNGLAESARMLVKNLRKGNMSEFDFVEHMRMLLEEYEWMKGVDDDRNM